MNCPGCGNQVPAAAHFCPRCNHQFQMVAKSSNLKIVLIVAAAAFGGLVVLPFVTGGLNKTSKSLEEFAESRPAEVIPAQVQKPTIDLQAFMNLKTGMSYGQAETVIGSPGVEQSRTEMVGISTVMYGWQNRDGSNAIVMFQNGKLVSKTQAMLR